MKDIIIVYGVLQLVWCAIAMYYMKNEVKELEKQLK